MPWSRIKSFIGAGLALGLVAVGSVAVRSQARQSEWRYFGGDKGFTRYSSLDQINQDNVKNLQVVWRRPAVDEKLTQAFPDLRVNAYLRSTPIMIDGMLYIQDAHGFISAFDPGTGTTIWQQEPFARTMEEVTGQSTRGVDYWQRRGRSSDPRRPRRVSVRAEREDRQAVPGLRRSGTREPAFLGQSAAGGEVRRHHGPARRRQRRGGDRQHRRRRRRRHEERGAREDVRGFDVKTGKQLWTFHVVPQQGEAGVETWGNESWKVAGDLGAWNPMSADEQLGYVVHTAHCADRIGVRRLAPGR